MIPNDLAGFSVEQLRGFATANRLEYDAVKAGDSEAAEKVSTLETLLDNRDRLNAAIEAALEAEAALAAVDAAANGEEVAAEDETEEPTPPAVDPDTAVDDAVAAATMGGGPAPRISVNEPNPNRGGDIAKFLSGIRGGSEIRHTQKIGFSTMMRETNHAVKRGSDATSAIIAARADRSAGTDKTAAGCFCGPDDARTAIAESMVADRPLSDTLPTLTVAGDYKFIRQVPLADALTGVTQWTCDNQDDFDPESVATWKPCFELDCGGEVTSAMYAVPACASFTTQQLIGNPELIANLEHVMSVAYNKTAELLVYNRLVALSSQYNYNAFAPISGYGASAKLLKAVAWAIEMARAAHRDRGSYDLVLPAGLLERVVVDGMVRGFGDYTTVADLTDRLMELGVGRITNMLDETGTPHTALEAPGGPAVAAPANPLAEQILLYRPDDYILGLAPELDLGVTRSPELARQNKLQWFLESFESVEKVGIAPSIAITADFCDSGVRPALGTGYDCGE